MFLIQKEFLVPLLRKNYFSMGQYLNSLSKVEKKINEKSIKKILFISGKNSFNKTGAKEIFKKVSKDKEKFLYIKKSNFPNLQELEKIIKFKESLKPDLIVAIGGGCSIDYAKIASVFNAEKNFKKKIINSDYFLKNKIRVLAIPTTAGSGAEVTSSAVIYINKIKYSVEGSELIPNYYSLIPNFLLSSNLKIDSSSGFDAISQSIESIFSKKSTQQSILFAKKGLKILFKNYNDFLKKKNIYNSYKMALGANLSGKAINISRTTAPHALSYPLTAHFNIPHGHAVSLTLNKFLKFNYRHLNKSNCNFDLNKRFQLLFNLTKSKNLFELDLFLNTLKKKASLEQNFSKLGVNIETGINRILNGLNDQRLANNPIKVSKKDIKYILENF